ncbi:hypothetical protein H4R35_003289, partial [Dimargaris xerosporica]
MTSSQHLSVSVGLCPAPVSPTAPWQVLLIGAQGSGKQTLAAQLAQTIPRPEQLVVHTTSKPFIPQPPAPRPKPPLHMDYVVLVVNLTDSQALAHLEAYLDLTPPEYFVG